MNRLQLVSALALSVGVTGWFNPAMIEQLRAGECNHPRTCQCQCASGNGLLDTLDDFAMDVARKRSHRTSILSAFKLHHSKCDSGCDKPASSGEATCGCEPTCGLESDCTSKPQCDVGARHASEVTRSHAVPQYNHSLGPIQYPPASMPNDVHVIPNQSPARPALPTPPRLPQPERIPVPTVEDSTIDPFRDDAASNSRPARLRVQPASQRTLHKTLPRTPSRPAMSFDPQSLSVPVPRPAVSGQKPKSSTVSSRLDSSRRTGARQSISDNPDSSSAEASVVSDQSERSSTDEVQLASSSSVVQAATERPARLPALKTARPVEQATEVASEQNEHADMDSNSVFNPLRSN